MEKDTVTIYWSIPIFLPKEESWNMLYREPEPLIKDILEKRVKTENSRTSMYSCPASNDFLKNIYTVKSNIDDTCIWPEGYLESINNEMSLRQRDGSTINLDYFGNKILFWSPRVSAMKDYVDVVYNMSWIFFAEEPLKCRFTAPYYPATSPAEGAILASGEFDIGQWFRGYNLNYYIPYKTNSFNIKAGDPLIYIQPLTDKKVEFKRFDFNEKLMQLSREFVESPNRYGKSIPLYKKYEMAKNSKILDIVLKEIKNNLVD